MTCAMTLFANAWNFLSIWVANSWESHSASKGPYVCIRQRYVSQIFHDLIITQLYCYYLSLFLIGWYFTWYIVTPFMIILKPPLLLNVGFIRNASTCKFTLTSMFIAFCITFVEYRSFSNCFQLFRCLLTTLFHIEHNLNKNLMEKAVNHSQELCFHLYFVRSL